MRSLAIAAASAVLLTLLVWFAWSQWQSARTSAATADLGADQAGAVSDSAKDAIGAVGGAFGREQALSTLGAFNADLIRAAPAASMAVDPALHDLAVAGLCRHASYQRDPECLRRSPAEAVE